MTNIVNSRDLDRIDVEAGISVKINSISTHYFAEVRKIEAVIDRVD
jgi:hypothetical protein